MRLGAIDEGDDLVEIRVITLGRVHIDRRRRNRDVIERFERLSPVCDPLSERAVAVSPTSTFAGRATSGSFEGNGSVDIAADDPQLGELRKRFELRLPEPVLECCFGHDAHARRDQNMQHLEEERESSLRKWIAVSASEVRAVSVGHAFFDLVPTDSGARQRLGECMRKRRLARARRAADDHQRRARPLGHDGQSPPRHANDTTYGGRLGQRLENVT